MDLSIDQLSFTNTVIKPPADKQKDISTVYLMVDSRDRNYSKFPDSNDYVFYLNESFRDVTEIELIAAHIPENGGYNINKYNNQLQFANTVGKVTGYDDDGSSIRENPALIMKANVPSGNYIHYKTNGLTLRDELSDALTIEMGKNSAGTFSIKNNINTNKYTVKKTTVGANESFTLMMNNGKEQYSQNEKQYKETDNSIGNILGFNRNYKSIISGNVTTTQNSDIITGVNTKFTTDLKHLDSGDKISIVNADIGGNVSIETLQLKEIKNDTELSTLANASNTRSYCELIPSKHISNTIANNKGDDYVLLQIPELEKYEGYGTAVQNAFAKIHLNKGTRQTVFGRIKTFTNIVELDPLPRLDRLHIQFRDYKNNLYDFNNAEHSLIFAISYRIQGDKYNY